MNSTGFAYRILVVDDEPSVLEISALVLKERGYEVRTASDGNRPAAAHCEECGVTFRTSSALTAYQASTQIRAEFDAHACKFQKTT